MMDEQSLTYLGMALVTIGTLYTAWLSIIIMVREERLHGHRNNRL